MSVQGRSPCPRLHYPVLRAGKSVYVCSIELGGAITRTTMHRSQPLRLLRAFVSINLLARLIKRQARLARYRREHRPLAGPRKGAWLPS